MPVTDEHWILVDSLANPFLPVRKRKAHRAGYRMTGQFERVTTDPQVKSPRVVHRGLVAQLVEYKRSECLGSYPAEIGCLPHLDKLFILHRC